MSEKMQGLVVAAHGRHYLAEVQGTRMQCVPRGKKSLVAVGDIVDLTQTAPGQAVINAITERKTLLYRSDQFKSKIIAANLSQIFIVTACEPDFSQDLLSRSLVAASAAGLRAFIILNKCDLTEKISQARSQLEPYTKLGYPIIELSIRIARKNARETLLMLLQNESSILIGQSGVGKSTILNALVPEAGAVVREISQALNSGRHTTTHATLYHLDKNSVVIDSPGFQEFGLSHLSEGMLERAFVEFSPFLGHCRFYNCHHLQEPGCSIQEAVAHGVINPMRHQLYSQLLQEKRNARQR